MVILDTDEFCFDVCPESNLGKTWKAYNNQSEELGLPFLLFIMIGTPQRYLPCWLLHHQYQSIDGCVCHRCLMQYVARCCFVFVCLIYNHHQKCWDTLHMVVYILRAPPHSLFNVDFFIFVHSLLADPTLHGGERDACDTIGQSSLHVKESRILIYM